MKLIHLSDLHIGIRLNEYSLADDQHFILDEILKIIKDEKPDAVIIAGDVYDKTTPSDEAVTILDEFLCALAQLDLSVFIISGNHDSAYRLSFANRLIEPGGIHISHVYNGETDFRTIQDEYGKVNIYMLPFVKPVHIRKFFSDAEINSYTDAVAVAVDNMKIDRRERNVLITHQFVTGAERSDSEDISVGGSDNIDAAVFDAFDYVALGHIHNAQNIKSERIRYCGTPLKYSISEANCDKSLTVVELKEKSSESDYCDISVRTVPLKPKRNVVRLKGSYRELTERGFYENTSYKTDFVHITLTDEDDITDAVGKLRIIYPNLLGLAYDNRRTAASGSLSEIADVERLSPQELFEEFYKIQNNSDMTDEQKIFIQKIIDEVWEGAE